MRLTYRNSSLVSLWVLWAAFCGLSSPLAGGSLPGAGKQAGERVVLFNASACGTGCSSAELLHSFGSTTGPRSLVTHVFNPSGGGGLYVAGTLFGSSGLPERLFASDALGGGVAVNAYVEWGASPENCIEVHETTAGSTAFNVSEITDPNLDGAPDRTPLLLPRVPNLDLSSNFGLWYSQSAGRWTIFAQNPLEDMPEGAEFYYAVPPCGGALLTRPIHVVTAENRNSHSTWLSGVTQRPQTMLLVTQLYGATAGVYNDHPIGVWWDPESQRWNIYNEDLAAMPLGAQFVVVEITVLFKHNFEDGNAVNPTLIGWSAVVP